MTPKLPNSKGRVPTSIKINEELWKEAKIEAIRQDIDVSELVEKAIQKLLKVGEKN